MHMLCLGTDAIMHSIRALCLVKARLKLDFLRPSARCQGFTADLVVQWAPGIKGEGREIAPTAPKPPAVRSRRRKPEQGFSSSQGSAA